MAKISCGELLDNLVEVNVYFAFEFLVLFFCMANNSYGEFS